MGKRKGKTTKKNKSRQQQSQQQVAQDANTAGATATSSGREEHNGDKSGGTTGFDGAMPLFVSEIEGMSDEWRAFYRAVSHAVQKL